MELQEVPAGLSLSLSGVSNYEFTPGSGVWRLLPKSLKAKLPAEVQLGCLATALF